MTKRKAKAENAGLGKGRMTLMVLGAILCAHIVLGLVYWHYTPFGMPPDEGPHARYVETLVRTRSLPVFDPSDRENYETHQPPLYYLIGTPFYLAGRAAGLEDPGAAVRLLSLLLGGLAILVIYRAVRRAFPRETSLALGCAGFVAFLPTHVMLSSSVSNDILAELVFGLALMLVAIMIVEGPTWWRTVGLGAVLGIGLLAKTTCVLLLPIGILAYLLLWQRGMLPARGVVAHAGAMLCLAVAIGGWWLARNQVLYGDPLAMSQFQYAFQHTAKPEFWLSRGWSWWMYFSLVATWTFDSFWGVFGHMNVFMPAWTYWGLAAVSVTVTAGSCKAILETRAGSDREVLFVYATTVALVLLAFVKFNTSFFQAQGRYLYPALLPIAVFWVLGIRHLLPIRVRKLAPYLAAGIPLAVQFVALAACII